LNIQQSNNLAIYINNINKFKLLTYEEEIKLVKLAKNNDKDAINTLIKSNLRLVISIARKMQGRGIDIEDLIQVGNIGLIQSIKKVDLEKYKVRFSTYATIWIKQQMLRTIAEQSRNIRIPIYIIDIVNKLMKTKSILEKEYHNSPTLFDIANGSNIPIDKAIYCINSFNTEVLSFSDIIHTSEENYDLSKIKISDLIKTDSKIDNYDNKDYLCKIFKLLDSKYKNTISKRDKEIFKQRIGINKENKIYSLLEIGNMHGGLSRERVRQIIEDIKNKIKKIIPELLAINNGI